MQLVGVWEGGREHTWVGCQAGQGGTKEAGVGGLLLLLLMSSAVITRFHGLPMGEPATVRFVYVLFIFMCCCCCCFRSVCVCVSASSFLALSLSSSVRRRRCGSVRFGGFKYYVMFSARDKRHLFMSFLEVWTPSNGAIYLPPTPSLSSFSPRFALLM